MENRYVSNPVYKALTSVHRGFAVQCGHALRFQPDVIPFAAVPAPTAECFADLAELMTPGEELFITLEACESVADAAGLEVVAVLPSLQMQLVAVAAPLAEDLAVEPVESAAELVALKAEAFPGFFGPRAPELGSFFGVRDAELGRLVAMGGERMATPAMREISGVCTLPQYTRRGYAASIVQAVQRHQAALGTGSMLHAAAGNQRVIALYERLGFRAVGQNDFVKLRRV